MQPVWQVTWTKQQLQLSGEEREEVLVSVTGDGRITKWLILHNGFNCVGNKPHTHYTVSTQRECNFYYLSFVLSFKIYTLISMKSQCIKWNQFYQAGSVLFLLCENISPLPPTVVERNCPAVPDRVSIDHRIAQIGMET